MAETASSGPIVPRRAPEPPENPVLRHLGWAPMWVEDSNAIWTVVGDPGDGKSLASVRIAEKIWPDFQIDHVASNIVEFMELVMADSLGQGSVIVLEEGGVEASAYEWYSESNEVFRTVLETWRHQNRMGIINLPNFQKLDKGARRRTDVIIEMLEAKPWKEYSDAKPKEVNYNNIDDFFTTPFPVLEGERHKRIRFNMPSDPLVNDYEELKDEYTSNLNERLYEMLVETQEAAQQEEISPQDIAQQILENEGVDTYIGDNNGQKYIDRDLIELEYDIGRRYSKKVKKILQRDIDREVA
jgi:hypothetical protein